jgi:hypothetical protein
MMKHRVICWCISAAALVGIATAQNSQVHSSSAKSPDSLKGATQPLTPKSAMPSKRKAATAVPNTSTSARKTNAELSRLERGPSKTASPNSGNAKTPKSASASKSATPPASGSGINFNYQKPVNPLPPHITKKN